MGQGESKEGEREREGRGSLTLWRFLHRPCSDAVPGSEEQSTGQRLRVLWKVHRCYLQKQIGGSGKLSSRQRLPEEETHRDILPCPATLARVEAHHASGAGLEFLCYIVMASGLKPSILEGR